jgi:hypothetical protein
MSAPNVRDEEVRAAQEKADRGRPVFWKPQGRVGAGKMHPPQAS